MVNPLVKLKLLRTKEDFPTYTTGRGRRIFYLTVRPSHVTVMCSMRRKSLPTMLALLNKQNGVQVKFVTIISDL